MTTSTVSKSCVSCKQEKPLSEFYVRSGVDNPTDPGHYNSECKDCLKERSKNTKHLDPMQPRTKTEILAIDYLRANRFPVHPGKAVHAADVDVVVWGHVWVEVKYAKFKIHGNHYAYQFNTTPKQQRRGFLAHIVLLICDHPKNGLSFHFFDAKDSVFYMNDRIKVGIEYVPGKTEAVKHGHNRVVMTQGMMDAAKDNFTLIHQQMVRIANAQPQAVSVTVREAA